MNHKEIDVSIIIVNYNTAKLLEDCIISVQEKTHGIAYEIIVIDNASSDNSVEILKKKFPSVKLTESKENLGFGRANNLGAKYASGKYLFLLNTDTLLINNAIKVLFDFMELENNLNVGACGGNLYKQDQSNNYSYSLYFPSLSNIFFYRFHISGIFRNNESFNETGKIKDVAIIIGADLFIRSNIFKKIGGFDTDYFMYVEDGDLQYRIKKESYRIVSVPNAKIIHLQGQSTNVINRLRMEIKSYMIFFKKHYDNKSLRIYMWIEACSAFSRTIAYFVLLKPQKGLEYLSIIKYILKIDVKK